MILVTRFDGSTIYINPELIRSIENTPDTVITLTSDYKIIVRDSVEDILHRFLEYQQNVHGDSLLKYLKELHKEEE